ncbi:MAG: DUF3343 domain-containing protein [Spirochaetaceae bacterium]|jgi:hypothetical protein|nr:DUF3343 domain-containing protein [Spirochaetaceae bacterium]
MRFLVTFHSVSSALLLETEAKERGLPCEIIPVPRSLSSSCGYAAWVELQDSGAAVFPEGEAGEKAASARLLELLDALRVEWESVCLPEADGRYKIIERNIG